MSKELNIGCCKCGEKTDESLVLSCNHILCTNCAADNLTRNELPGINEIQFVICDICQTKTGIDRETSKEILSLRLKDNNRIKTERNNNKHSRTSSLFKNNDIFSNSSNVDIFNTTNNLLSPNNNVNKTVNLIHFNSNKNIFNDSDFINIKENYMSSNICKEHGEATTYLCLDCMSNCICPECIIHGNHKNHEVLNIKKAYPIIYNKTQEMGNNINSKIKEFYLAKNNIEQKKNELFILNKKYKTDIKETFNEIRSLLDKKEKEILNQIQTNLSNTLNELNNYNNIIQSKMAILNKLLRNINDSLRGQNKFNLINFYSENKNKITEQMEMNELSKLKIDTVPNIKVNIDKNSFNNLLSAIHSLNFEIIPSVEKMDSGKNNNIGKIRRKNPSGQSFKKENNDINSPNIPENMSNINVEINNN